MLPIRKSVLITIGVGVNTFNKTKDVFDNPSLHGLLLKTAYEYRVSDAFSVRLRMAFMFYTGINPNSSISSTVDWSGNTLNASLDDEYNLRKLSRYYRNAATRPKYAGDDHRAHIIGVGINYRPNRYWAIDPVTHYLDGDYTLYNNNNTITLSS